jgi:hypothetical protein
MSNFEKLKDFVADLERDFTQFYEKGNKAAGTRVRKAMQDLKQMAQDIRVDIQDRKQS